MKRIIVTTLFIGILLLSACGGTTTAPSTKPSPVPTPLPTPTPTPAQAPALFPEQMPKELAVNNLQAIPAPDLGENQYKISVDIENTGTSKCLYKLSCKIDGNEIESYEIDNRKVEPIEVELNPSEKKTITLRAAELIILGLGAMYRKGQINQKEHTISVEDLSITVTLTKPLHNLQILSLNDETSYGFITVRGQIRNISGENMHNIEAVVQYYTAEGIFVKSDSALIEYNPLLPNQVSPFEVITDANPDIARYSVSFKFLFGGTIPTEDRR